MSTKPAYIPLSTAAAKLQTTPAALRALCESDAIECHGAQYGDTYIVSALTVERLSARAATCGGTAL